MAQLAAFWAKLTMLVSTIRFSDIVDILIVAYLIYNVIMLIRKTNSYRLAQGVLLILIALWLSGVLKLTMFNRILQKTVELGLIALVIIFQPELRRALEQIGRGKLFHKGSELDEQELEEMLDSVAHATKVMSKNKVGALMVFERATGLAERIETGVPIDGLVSSGLLQNIFVKDTPLHDGAVVIRGNRVVAACCLLPLTENRNLSQELGTRHRAAIGMSEQSDAMILVVSEETGTISIARNGELMRYLTVDDVKEILRTAIFRPHAAVKNSLVDKIKSLWGGEKK